MGRILFCILIMINASRVCAQSEPDVDALVKRGFAQIQNKASHQEALKDFERVIELAPSYVDAYIGKAIILKRLGRWHDAKETLWTCSQHIQGDQAAGRYLAESAWQEGFYALARELDLTYPPDDKRRLLEYTNEIALNYGYDWIDNRPDWWELNFTYNYRIRPDHSVSLYYSDFTRDQDNDFLIGMGYAYKWNHVTTLAYDIYLSDDSGFTAEQKHRPRAFFKLPSNFLLGVGGNFDEFTDHWAQVSHTEITKYIRPYYVKYVLLAGVDNFNQRVTTHIGEAGYEQEDKYTLRMGYATGNESLEKIDRVIDSSVIIDSYFFNGKYFVTQDWGLNFSLMREYRASKYFRTSGSTSVFYRF